MNTKLRAKLTPLHRAVCIRVYCAYGTISIGAVAAIAKLAPFELAAWERYARYTVTPKEDTRQELIRKWQLA